MANETRQESGFRQSASGPIALTADVQRGLRALIRMAIEDDYLTVREIVNKENIPPMNLERIFVNFQESGLIEAKEGTAEGYILGDDPKKITLKMIIESMQEKMNLVRCIEEDCEKSNICRSEPVWKSLDKIIKKKFQDVTLFDLVENYDDN